MRLGRKTHCVICEKKLPASTLPKNTMMSWNRKKRVMTPRSTWAMLTAPAFFIMLARMRGTSHRKILRARPVMMKMHLGLIFGRDSFRKPI